MFYTQPERQRPQSKSLRTFVKEHRIELEAYVGRRTAHHNDRPSLAELEDWVNNDEHLYTWAQGWGWRG